MKKNLLITFLLISVAYFANAQTFKGSSFLSKGSKFESKIYETDVIITPATITIKNWGNSNEDFIMKINKIETKPYDDKVCTWYYCTSTKKGADEDMNGNYRKNICILDSKALPSSLIIANFFSEVDIHWYQILFKLNQ